MRNRKLFKEFYAFRDVAIHFFFHRVEMKTSPLEHEGSAVYNYNNNDDDDDNNNAIRACDAKTWSLSWNRTAPAAAETCVRVWSGSRRVRGYRKIFIAIISISADKRCRAHKTYSAAFGGIKTQQVMCMKTKTKTF